MSLILEYITLLTTVVDLGGVRRGVLHLTGRDRHYKKKKQKQTREVFYAKRRS